MPDPSVHHWRLPAEGDRQPLAGELHLPDGDRQGLPVVLFSPDLLLPRTWGFYPFLAREVGRHYGFLVYDPALSGFDEEGGDVLARPELLERYTPARELEDLSRIVAAVQSGGLPGAGRLDPTLLVTAGHGKGAAIALLGAARDRSVRAVLGLAAYSTLLRFPPTQREELLRVGHLEMEAPLSGQKVRLSRALLEEVEADPGGFSLQEAVQRLEVPVVFIHGEEDLEVSVKESESLYHWSRKERTRLVLMEKLGHAFGADHPFRSSNKDLDRMVEIFVNFVAQSLAG